MRVLVAISGASGAIYARRLLGYLVDSPQVATIYVIFTQSGKLVWQHEIGLSPESVCALGDKVELLGNDDFFVSIASGSAPADAMVIAPASMGSVGRIAGGVSSTLIERAADVQLKERLPLIIVTRETPYSLIHLRNMTALTEAGATILPASPSFYSGAQSIEELVDTVVERILDKIGVKNQKKYRWN